jgi:hypothetical protein
LCGSLLLFAVTASQTDENVISSASLGEYLARTGVTPAGRFCSRGKPVAEAREKPLGANVKNRFSLLF